MPLSLQSAKAKPSRWRRNFCRYLHQGFLSEGIHVDPGAILANVLLIVLVDIVSVVQLLEAMLRSGQLLFLPPVSTRETHCDTTLDML